MSAQQTRDIEPMLARRLQRRSNIGSMPRVCWEPSVYQEYLWRKGKQQ